MKKKEYRRMDYCEFIKCHWGEERFDMGACATASSGETCYTLYSHILPNDPKFVAYEIYLVEETDLKVECIFCNKELEFGICDGYHHILPRQFIKILDLHREWRELEKYKVPVCKRCHDILTELQKPLILITKHYRGDHQLQLDVTLPTIMSRIDEIRTVEEGE